MFIPVAKNRTALPCRIFITILLLIFLNSFIFCPTIIAQDLSSFSPGLIDLPVPGTMIKPSSAYKPLLIEGLTIFPEDPLRFNFILDQGETQLEGQALRAETRKLVKYFLAALTVPEDEIWVNLSPYEKDHIIAEGLGGTELGRDLLAQDYILKQLAASMLYPEDELGQKFWERVYRRAYEEYGTINIPLNTFNKVWIVPEQAGVYLNGQSVFVVESRLKVMLEEDYLALGQNLENGKFGTDRMAEDAARSASGMTSEIVREILIPELEREVNEGRTFANLRQIVNSLILATWFKENLRSTILGQVYANQNKTAGIDIEDKDIKEKIYQQYLAALKKGVFDFIKEDVDPGTQEPVARQYFSGGFNGRLLATPHGIQTYRSLSPAQRSRLSNVPQRLTAFVKLRAEAGNFITGQKAYQEHEETIDAIFEDVIYNPATEDWIKRHVVTEELLRQSLDEKVIVLKESIQVVKAFFDTISARKGLEQLKDIQEIVEGLVRGSFAKNPLTDISPRITVVDIQDQETFDDLLDGQPFVDGHASDRGIHLLKTDPRILLHEIIAFIGGSHEGGVAFEVLLETFIEKSRGLPSGQWAKLEDIFPSGPMTPSLQPLEREYEKRFNRILSARGGVVDGEEGFTKALWETVRALRPVLANGRPATLLSDMAKFRGPNQRDYAAVVPFEEETLIGRYLKKETEEFSSEEGAPGAEEQIDKRLISFRDGLYRLTSRRVRRGGAVYTDHVFSGHALTDWVMRKEGDELNYSWEEILKEMETSTTADGVPIKDGLVSGNGYLVQMSADEAMRDINERYQNTQWQTSFAQDFEPLRDARAFLSSSVPVEEVVIIESRGQVTFGAALVVDQGRNKIVLEQGFLDMIKKKGNPYNLLTRVMVYLLNGGTHEQNRIAEYEYAKKTFPDLAQHLPVNVESVYQDMILDQLEPEGVRKEEAAAEIMRKTKESLWEIGVHMMNQEVYPDKVGWSEEEKNFVFLDETAGVQRAGIYGLKSDPFHFGHLESALRYMAQNKLWKVAVFVQRFDYRKVDNMVTFKDRQRHTKELTDLSQGLLVTVESPLLDDNAEANLEYMISHFENPVRGRFIEFYYLAGGDHGHVIAPATKIPLREDGSFQPVVDETAEGPKFRPDTAKLLFEARERLHDHMVKNNLGMVVSFNTREPFEILPMKEEIEQLQELMREGFVRFMRHLNLIGISSTQLRKTLSGKGKFSLTFIPLIVQDYIRAHGQFRGWMTRLPTTITRLGEEGAFIYPDAEKENADKRQLQLWLQNENYPDAEAIARLFNVAPVNPAELELAPWKKDSREIIALGEKAKGQSIPVEIIERALQKAGTLETNGDEEEPDAGGRKRDEDQETPGQTGRPENDLGGIDLNSALFNLKVYQGGQGLILPVNEEVWEEFNIQVEGFTPIILQITPVSNIPLLFGEGEDTEEFKVSLR